MSNVTGTVLSLYLLFIRPLLLLLNPLPFEADVYGTPLGVLFFASATLK